MSDQPVQPVLVKHISLESPESGYSLGGIAASVAIDIIKETGLIIPHILVNPLLQELHLILHLLYLLPALDVESDLHEAVVHKILLEVGVQPCHVAIGEYLVVAFRDAGHVVHTGTPAAGPVGSVLPSAVELPPLGICHKRWEHLMEPVDIPELLVIQQFCPRQKIGASGSGIVALEAVGAIRTDLPADETILVLLGVEIIQRPLEREETVPLTGKHHHERIIPHEYIPVVSDIKIRGDEA